MCLLGWLPLYYTLFPRYLHAAAALPLVTSLLAVDGDSSCSPAPGDQIATILEVTLPVYTCDGLKRLELFFALLLGHDVSGGW